MTDGHEQHHHAVPPSAAGYLDPYSARVTLRPAAAGFDPQPFLAAFLEEVATGCVGSGATVIGHLKCFLQLPGGGIACSLTSLRAGATCAARVVAMPVVLAPGSVARLDLALLVYGLSGEKIDALAREALSRLLDPRGVAWSLETERATPPSVP